MYTHTHVYVTTTKENRVINLKDNKEGYIVRFSWRKRRREEM